MVQAVVDRPRSLRDTVTTREQVAAIVRLAAIGRLLSPRSAGPKEFMHEFTLVQSARLPPAVMHHLVRIDSQATIDGCSKVIGVKRGGDRISANTVGGADHLAFLNASAKEERRVCPGPMITTRKSRAGMLRYLWRPPKFTHDDD